MNKRIKKKHMLDKIEKVGCIKINEKDTLIVKINQMISSEEAQGIYNVIRDITGHERVLILPFGMEIIKKSENEVDNNG